MIVRLVIINWEKNEVSGNFCSSLLKFLYFFIRINPSFNTINNNLNNGIDITKDLLIMIYQCWWLTSFSMIKKSKIVVEAPEINFFC
jgi:hypothetical protein